MNILILSHMFPYNPKDPTGLFILKQAQYLQPKLDKICIVSPVPLVPKNISYLKRRWLDYYNSSYHTFFEGIEVYRPRYLSLPKIILFSYSGESMLFGGTNLWKILFKKYDFSLIHAHVALPDGYCAMLLADKYKIPFIVTIHGQDLQQTIWKGKRCRNAVKRVLEKAKKVIVVSDKLKKIASLELGINDNKLTIVHNGIDKNVTFKPDTTNEIFHNKKIVLSVSNLYKTKGIDLNLQAIALLKDKFSELLYLIIGEGPERRNLELLVGKLRIQNNVIFLGKLPNIEVLKYMSNCDIFSLPSFVEGFGVSYLEAMLFKKPVIAVQGEGIDGVVIHGKTGFLVPPKDVNALAHILETLLLDNIFGQKVGLAGQKLVLDNFSWEQSAEKVLNVYQNIIQNIGV